MSIAAFRYVFFKVTATGTCYLHYARQCKARKASVADPFRDPVPDPWIRDSE